MKFCHKKPVVSYKYQKLKTWCWRMSSHIVIFQYISVFTFPYVIVDSNCLINSTGSDCEKGLKSNHAGGKILCPKVWEVRTLQDAFMTNLKFTLAYSSVVLTWLMCSHSLWYWSKLSILCFHHSISIIQYNEEVRTADKTTHHLWCCQQSIHTHF